MFFVIRSSMALFCFFSSILFSTRFPRVSSLASFPFSEIPGFSVVVVVVVDDDDYYYDVVAKFSDKASRTFIMRS
jgi:hypothetical protein